jgi:hypothetical protein
MTSPKPRPSWEDIEKAWQRPAWSSGQPSNTPYVRAVYRWQRGNRLLMKLFMTAWFTILGGVLVASTIDVLFGLGWGLTASDIVGSALMIGFGIVFCGFLWFVMGIVGSITRARYGPDPLELERELERLRTKVEPGPPS